MNSVRFCTRAKRRIGDRVGEGLGECRCLVGAFANNDRSGKNVADALVATAQKDHDQPDRIDRQDKAGNGVADSQQISRDRFPQCERPAVVADDAQLQQPLARRLAVPEPFEDDEVTGEESEEDKDQDRDRPFRHLGQGARPPGMKLPYPAIDKKNQATRKIEKY